jgi:hypothetical protein
MIPRIEVKQTWGEVWAHEPALRVAGVLELGVGAEGRDQVSFVHKYGPGIKRVDQHSMSQASPLDYMNWWVRIVNPDPPQTILWQGMFKADRRKVRRRDTVPHGMQTLVAIGPTQMLKRIVVNTSRWWNETYQRYYELDWVPAINVRGSDKMLQGTKGAAGPGGPYGYGVDDTTSTSATWTYAEYLDYLRYFYIQQTPGPTWTIDDLTNTLASRTEPVRFQSSQTALAMLRKLIRPSDGIEFVIIPTTAGYEIKVFAIAKDAVKFKNASLPANGEQMVVNPSTDPLVIDCEAEASEMQTCDKLEIQGERIEACFTIAAAEKASLWASADETAYKTGSTQGSPTTAEHDLARGDDKFRLVYQGFGAPANWDWSSGQATIVLDQYGDYYSTNAERQNVIRRTLSRLPLKEGGVYTGATVDETNATEDFVPPLAIGYVSAARGYAMLDKLSHADLETDDSLIIASASIRVLENEWGIITEFPANYMHANNHWAAGSPAATGGYGITDPDTECIDYDDTLFTIAAETDKRLKCWQTRSSQANDGSKAVLEVPKARCQWLEPSAAVGVDTDGTVKSASSNGLLIRNDNEALHQLMAGAIARYLSERFAYSVTWKASVPVPDYLGQILVMGNDEGDLSGKWGLVTSIWLDFENGTSGMRAGYA